MKKKGFTLIELLVVISIISLLASVVLSSLNSARQNSRAAAVKAQALEARKLMELEFLATGSYARLEQGWVKTDNLDGSSTPTCATQGFTGPHEANMRAICQNINSIIEASGITTGNLFITRDDGGTNDAYSIMVKLPNSAFYFCLGSNGASSDLGTSSNDWTAPGCFADPTL